ncbi:hypothetical protein IW140_000925 [Coemansia sp. RSA 1813]|nr:hypothetical protein EV178_001354 [Coemansia sp. RSA 1646]KAJ1772894.1 hypothetical protein LPJ74_001032 [Coemansia sp. RSA 1843]KAJ2093466.1 hypothetical protein IW138_000316 [Coemansia sp. RSA 986]KAJ2217275.1 hypothetical protein EV179_000742 [Coemansia sp. RSA 487]KAJ2572474.1 hypothetical protein IW140_000925 [Coemansia sp. RSA 1813]
MTVQKGREDATNINSTAPAISIKGSSKEARFPGVGRTLSESITDNSKDKDKKGDKKEKESDNASDDEVADKGKAGTDEGSDFDEEEYEEAYQSEDDDLDNEEYSSDEDEDAARGGSSVYNLRSPALKRKIDSGVSDDEDTGPSLRTRQKIAVAYDEYSEDNASASKEGSAFEDEDED